MAIAPPVKVAGDEVVGPTGVAVGVLPAPLFPPEGLDTVPLLEPPFPLPVGELLVPVPTEPDPLPDPEPDPLPPVVPLVPG